MMRRILWSAMTPSVPCVPLARHVRQSLAGILGLGMLVGTVTAGWAEMYRWRDAAGRVHFTDNRLNIPQAYRAQAQTLTADSATATESEGPMEAAPEATPAHVESADASQQRRQIPVLEQRIAAAEQERQGYLDQLNAVRPIRTNPAFGQQRRRVAAVGRDLATVERRLDALRAELQQTQDGGAAAQESLEGGTMAPPPYAPEMASGWQQRVQRAQERIRQAQERRQVVLAQLSGDTEHQREGFGRRGREVLAQAQELQHLAQEIRSAEADLRGLNEEAARAGVPPEGRQ